MQFKNTLIVSLAPEISDKYTMLAEGYRTSVLANLNGDLAALEAEFAAL
jgi:hypothetical protein